MKKMFMATMMALGVIAVAACSGKQETTLTGKIDGIKSKYILFGGILNQNSIDTIAVNEDGSFSAKLALSEPKTDYIFFEEPKSGFKIYLEPGTTLDCQVELYDTVMMEETITRCRLKFSGDNVDCVEFLNNEDVHYYNLQGKALTEALEKKLSFDQFRALLESKVKEAKKVMDKLSNPKFAAEQKADYDKKIEAVLPYFGEFMPVQDEGYKKYLTSADLNDLTNLTKAGMYAKYYQKFEMPATTEDNNISFLRLLPKLFTNAEVISGIADQKIMSIITSAPTNLEEIFTVYKEVKGDKPVPEGIQKQFEQFNAMSAGKEATDFDMYDTEGKKVMLSDLKGKAVYMDCWATWCGPCKAEIPYMEKLYEHYKNNPNIVLVSVSLDKKKDAWLAMLKKDNPGWPQYIVKDEFNSKLCQAYSITGIPRFMMFDKEGKVISLDAPRPSSEGIIAFIDEALNK